MASARRVEEEEEEEEEDDASLWGRVDLPQFDFSVRCQDQRKVVLTAVQDQDLSICQGRRDFASHGHCVWDAALLLAEFLQSEEQRGAVAFSSRKVVELGAGVGLVGMALAVLGGDVVLTDQEYALPLLRKNVQVNFGSDKSHGGSTPLVEECQWGESLKGVLSDWRKRVDLIVFSDVLYHESSFLLLMQSIRELAAPTCDVYFSYETRNASIEAGFLGVLSAEFDVRMIAQQDNEAIFAKFDHPDELFVYHARPKTPSQ